METLLLFLKGIEFFKMETGRIHDKDIAFESSRSVSFVSVSLPMKKELITDRNAIFFS